MDHNPKMTCEMVEHRMAAWIDGQLSPYEYELMSDHLINCYECSRRLDELAELDIRPPKIRKVIYGNYWSKMDDVLSKEMDQWSSPRKSFGHQPFFWFLAASLLLSLCWGMMEHERAQELQALVEHQQKVMEKMERLSEYPEPLQKPKSYIIPAKHIPSRVDL